MSTPPPALGHRIVELACLAPSVHNTQPWMWRVTGSTVELHADRGRQLRATDPDGRNLVISCGAALHHAIVVARAQGLDPDVLLLPEPSQPDLLARIRLSTGTRPPDAVESLDLIGQRRTDRRRFTSWPVPDERLALLARAASEGGVQIVPLVDVTARHRTDLLLDRAARSQASDAGAVAEQHAWIEHGQDDGVPEVAAAPATGRRVAPLNRFTPDAGPAVGDRLVESTDGLMVIGTASDDQRAWLQAGEALSALWLRATRDGLSIVPLSQAIEVAETRAALRHDVLAGRGHPQLLVRVGWQEISRTDLARTPRRPLAEVLLP
jgi:hypothetical protein